MDKSAAVANPFNVFGKKSSQPEVIRVKFNPDDLYYDMQKKKYLLIFNNYEFDETDDFGCKPETLDGTEADVGRLRQVFVPLGFQVTLYNNLTYDDIIATVINVIKEDHINNTSCICIAIITHGFEDGGLCARERPYNLKALTALFEDKKLVTIPKLFFIQACRGNKADEGTLIECDSARKILHVPTHIDFLMMHSSVEGYSSYIGQNGTWMIQTLCNIIESHHRHCDILTMITFVNHIVAQEYSSYNKEIPEIHMKKQTVETRFTLTKLFKF